MLEAEENMVPTGAVAAAVETGHEARGARHMLLLFSDPKASVFAPRSTQAMQPAQRDPAQMRMPATAQKGQERCGVDLCKAQTRIRIASV